MTVAANDSFDLLEKGWIPARLHGGTTDELSIREVFHRARDIRELGGELPTQTFAIIRLLLAIVYRAAGSPVDADRWALWWDGGLPLDNIDGYLDRFHDRFDLLHPDRPFFQVADLATARGEVKDVAPLIFDLPSNNRLFTNRAGEGATRLSYAEAARWVVNAQAFDPSGIKSGAIGDPRVKNGKGYPIGLAWTGLLGGVLNEGDDLHETLLLNLVGGDSDLAFDLDGDLPPWEDDVPDSAVERGIRPLGPVRLFTWQSRRIRLVSDGSHITGCLIANGDALTPQNLFAYEPHTAWRYSEPQSKRARVTTYMPREHRPDRAFWRGISALLPATTETVKGIDLARSPANVRWVGFLQEERLLNPRKRIRLRAIGVVYGSNNSVVDDIVDDRLTVSLALLSEQHPVIAAEAENAVRLAEEGIRALRRLAENLAKAAGGDGEGPRARAEERAYARLDGEYRTWLARLDADSDPAAEIATWRETARTVLHELGAALVRDAGPTAWVGRELAGHGGTELVNTSRAESWFLRALHNTFGSSTGKDQAA
ncbi:type I-E CRISPR-associated protein Cse1/CasA [Microbacterium sp.]|uniref:type I-E CRISPR-associated protein Cse1/CasA n=1 Tax=Microbacterium sp. TaxID=51671 RepID=UPI0039E3B79D